MHTTNSTVSSADGTTIAFDVRGAGPTVILLGGVLGDRSQQEPVAELLAGKFTVVNVDRRGHGASGFTGPYDAQREVEDLAAVLADAGAPVAGVYATSGCAMIALRAAAHGVPTGKLVLWEPPFVVNGSRPPIPADYRRRLEQLQAEGRRGDMVELFMTEAAAIPAEFVAGMRQAPFWEAQGEVAHTLVYDAALMGDYSVPREFGSISTPALVLDGGTTPWMTSAADAVARTLGDARRRTLHGQMHNVAPDAVAPAIAEFMSD
jgi:pimeloyl-ACP methyl ester carboxylesterase